MSPPESSPESSSNPFAPPPEATPGIEAMMATYRRRMIWMVIGVILIVVTVAALDLWMTFKFVNQQQHQMGQTQSAVIEHARRFRNNLDTAEENIRQIVQRAELQQRNLAAMASNSSAAYAQILSNNLVTAVLTKNSSTATKNTEEDSLAVRNSRRNVQEIEVEMRLALERTRESFRNTASNLLGTYTAELNGTMKDVKKRALEADQLVAQLKAVETEVKKTKQSVDAVFSALRTPLNVPPTTPPVVTPAPAPPAPAAAPPVRTAPGTLIPAPGPGPSFSAPVAPRPVPATNPPAASPGN